VLASRDPSTGDLEFRMRLSRLSAGAVAVTAAVLALTAAPASAAETDTVRPARVGVDWHLGDTRFAGSAAFESTYGGGNGTSSALVLRTPGQADKIQMLSDDWSGTPLADIDALGYETYLAQPSTTGVGLPALNLRVRLSATDVGRYLVFEPYLAYGNAAVHPGQWQRWDALGAGGGARWWLSGANSPCPQDAPCTWAALVAAFPTARVQEEADRPGSLGFNQGTYNTGQVAAADMLHVAAGERDVTYDFEADVVLGGKDDCKNGGWARSTMPTFRNQGDCVSSFASTSKSRNLL
jgi:hypothetical protein